jgi:hypothetical protein
MAVVGEGNVGLAFDAPECVFGSTPSLGVPSVKLAGEGPVCKSGNEFHGGSPSPAGASSHIPNCPNKCKKVKLRAGSCAITRTAKLHNV